ncbi:MAG: hypothetical protein CXT69_03320 [Methanobacteriota archaeon]|nr:MAG: hypothetical protein CXT69_03320 [Euryarchaeota archaeon]
MPRLFLLHLTFLFPLHDAKFSSLRLLCRVIVRKIIFVFQKSEKNCTILTIVGIAFIIDKNTETEYG